LLQALAQEMMKLLKGKQVEQNPDNLHSYAYFIGKYSINSHSNIWYAVSNSYSGSWMVDKGESGHMTSDLNQW